MLDNQLYQMLRQCLIDQAPLRGITDSAYVLRYQPTQQGRASDRSVYMFKIADKRYGYRKATYVQTVDGLQQGEEQAIESTIQFSVTQPQAIQDNELTHADVLKTIAACVQSPTFIAALLPFEASVLRVQDIRNTPFNNDRDQWEENPSFDLVVKHSDKYVSDQRIISAFEFRVIPVPDLAA